MNVDTRNKVTSQSNIKAQTGLTYAETADGGNVVGSENLMLDGVGDLTVRIDRILCPFVASDAYIPAFCNIVQSGSKYDLTIGSVTTSANERFVGTDSTDPVVMNYAINVKPYGTSQGQFPQAARRWPISRHIPRKHGTVSTVRPVTLSIPRPQVHRVPLWHSTRK